MAKTTLQGLGIAVASVAASIIAVRATSGWTAPAEPNSRAEAARIDASSRTDDRDLVPDEPHLIEQAPIAALPASAAGAPARADAPPEEQVDLATEHQIALTERFERDSAPTAGAKAVEQSLRAAFSSRELQGTRLERVECRATTCRVAVTFNNIEADRDDMRRLIMSPSSAIPTTMALTVADRQELPDGRIEATIFIHSDTSG
jgi:hypothetical protein